MIQLQAISKSHFCRYDAYHFRIVSKIVRNKLKEGVPETVLIFRHETNRIWQEKGNHRRVLISTFAALFEGAGRLV